MEEMGLLSALTQTAPFYVH